MVPALALALPISEDHFYESAVRDQRMEQITFDRSDSSWEDNSWLQVAPAQLRQSSQYSQLRVVIPSTSSVVSPDELSPAASAGTCSGPSTPGSQSVCRGAFVGGLLTGRLSTADEAAQQQQHNMGPLSSSSAARTLLACDCSSHEGVSNWLDQQIIKRVHARAAGRSLDSPAASMEMAGKEAAPGVRCATSRAGLPPPAFQLLGLL